MVVNGSKKVEQLYFDRIASTLPRKFGSGRAPTQRSTTVPFLTTIIIGMLITPYRCDNAGFSSTFTFATSSLSGYSCANRSTAGSVIRQGPHHGAQKSTRTGTRECNTSWSNVRSVMTFGTPVPDTLPLAPVLLCESVPWLLGEDAGAGMGFAPRPNRKRACFSRSPAAGLACRAAS